MVRRKTKRPNPVWKNYAVLGLATVVFFGGAFLVWISTFKIPTLDSFEERKVVESTKIYDKTGEILLYDVNQDIKRTVVPFDEISRNVKNATIAIEDREFYQHHGIKPTSILRAIFANTTTLGYSQGGSTITQQVVKLSLLSREKTISRKIKEWVLALKLEKLISKDQILSLYLNEIPYGGSVYGVEEASEVFFGKKANDLTMAESAYLAALPQAPTYFSPFGNHKDKLEERKNLVLKEMLGNNFISKDEYEKAKSEKIVFKPKETFGIRAPHFVFYIIEELNKKYGEDLVRDGGLRIKTTLDYKMQEEGEGIAKKYALENKTKFNAENAAFVAIDPKSGGILAMIGSRDYFDKEIEGNFNVTTAHRQPGSTFKPFVYAQAFNEGYTPETVLFDVKTQFSSECAADNLSNESPCYAPDDYDGKFRGPITLRDSLAQSINITSIKTLYLAGIKDSINLARDFGIEGLGNADQYGLTLVLGGGEVTPLEMTGAYSVFANEGVRNQYTGILEVADRVGKILESLVTKPKEVLPRETALKISSILSDNKARAPAYGQTSFLYFPERDVAVKTGTTNDYKDAWIIGYTPSVTLGAWAGNNDNTPMEKKVAGFIVAPMWRAFMDKILATSSVENFPLPAVDDSFDLKPALRGHFEGGISYKIDTVSGKNATEYTPKETTKELFGGGVHSILYWLDKNNPLGPQPTNPENDRQFLHWEYGVQQWLKSSAFVVEENPRLPQGLDDVHGPLASLSFTILSPINESVYEANQKIPVTLQSRGKFPVTKAEYYVNGAYIGESTGSVFSLTPNEVSSILDKNELRVVVVDSVFNKVEASVSFQVSSP
jgi:1A family penicillin-binding protein